MRQAASRTDAPWVVAAANASIAAAATSAAGPGHWTLVAIFGVTALVAFAILNFDAGPAGRILQGILSPLHALVVITLSLYLYLRRVGRAMEWVGGLTSKFAAAASAKGAAMAEAGWPALEKRLQRASASALMAYIACSGLPILVGSGALAVGLPTAVAIAIFWYRQRAELWPARP